MKLIYVMDPQCGWCHGNAQNMSEIQEEFRGKLEMELLIGGMWLAPNAPSGGENLSRYLQQNGPRMSATTGAKVGEAYYELAKDSSYTFSSLEACAAIVLVKETAPEQAFPFAKKVQEALFIKGDRLNNEETYLTILKEMSLDTTTFEEQWMKEDNFSKTKAEIASIQGKVNGFPALLIQNETNIEMLASGYFNLDGMRERLREML